MLCDLHTHSVFSDGTCTPAELVEGAIDAGLSAIALTDHNTVGGLPAFLSAARKKRIDAVPGAEFSVDHNGKELHVLGLWISPVYFEQVTELMTSVNRRKEESNLLLIESLRRAGYPLDYEAIKAATPGGQINRAHIAAAMVQRGYLSTVKEGFDTVLSKSAGHYVEPKRPSAEEIIGFIRSIGAVAVLAHPFLNLGEQELVEFLSKTKGLCGMECYYSTYDSKATAASLRIAETFGLLCSGGSDFHGATKPDIRLGVGRGDLRVPYACYLKMKEAAHPSAPSNALS